VNLSPGAQPEPRSGPDPALDSERRSTFGRRLVWSVLVLLILYLATAGGGWQGIYAVGLRILSLVVITMVLGAWIAVAIIRPTWRPRTVLWPAFLAALIVFGVSLAASRTPRLGADYLAYALLLTALYLLFQRFMAQPYFRAQIGRLSIALLLVVGGWYALAVLQDWTRWWGLVGRITTPPLRPYFEGLIYGNPSAVMTMAVLFLGPSVAQIGFGSPPRRVAVTGLAILVLIVTVVSGSRAGWLGLGLGICMAGAIWLIVPTNRAAAGRLLGQRWVRIAAALGIAAGGVASIVFGPAILLRTTAGGEELRATFYQASIRMFQDSPLLGTGPGTWVALRTSYTMPGEIDYYVPHAHSIYAQTLSEFGLLGVAAGIIVLVCLAQLIKGAILGPDPIRRRFGWAALLGVAYFGAHQALDFYPNMPAALFAFVIPIAWLDATAPHPARRFVSLPAQWQRSTRRIGAAAGIAVIVTSCAWLARSEAVALQAAQAGIAATRSDWTGALPEFMSVATSDPEIAAYQMQLGIAAANTGDLVVAETALKRAARVDNLPSTWLNLAAVRVAVADDPGARDALRRALALGAQQAGINLGAGVISLRLRDQAGAEAAFITALMQAPSLAGDPWWQASSDIAAIWPLILDEAIRRSAGWTALDIVLSSGNLERATEIAAGFADPGDREFAGFLIAAWDGNPQAILRLYERAIARPLDTFTLGWSARVAARSGDQARAAAFRIWMDGPNPGSSSTSYEVRVTTEPSDKVAGMNSLFYGHYTYRRPTSADQLVSALPHLEFRGGDQ